MKLTSKIYRGWIRHRRYRPKQNAFKYSAYMLYLNLDEVDQIAKMSALFRVEKMGLLSFWRKDFLGDEGETLKCSVLDLVEARTGERPEGDVFLLANIRCFGFLMNPLGTYFIFDANGVLHSMVANVTNTPWSEQHAYVLQCDNSNGLQRFQFAKQFHVSPFNPLDMDYRWVSNVPSEKVVVHIENWQHAHRVMDATLVMDSMPMTARNLRRIVFTYPLITLKVAAAIYWQALKLWIKQVPYVPHSVASVELKSCKSCKP